MSSSEIDAHYEIVHKNASDINEHIPTLYLYSLECDHIVEMGVRSCVSTWAFLKGLIDSSTSLTEKHLVGVDYNDFDARPKLQHICDENKIKYTFLRENSATVDFGPSTDLLFIDTWHVYGHLKRELENHYRKVKKYIIMHDTEVDKIWGETSRCRYYLNPEQQAQQYGYPLYEITCGLKPALDEFLAKHPEFVIHKHYPNNNGLTVLKRIGPSP